MFCVIYSFMVKPSLNDQFEQSWRDLTNIIYKNAGSLGSRLHRDGNNEYIAYAQWPDKELWKNASAKLPEESKNISQLMKDSCEKIETLYELDVIDASVLNYTWKELFREVSKEYDLICVFNNTENINHIRTLAEVTKYVSPKTKIIT